MRRVLDECSRGVLKDEEELEVTEHRELSGFFDEAIFSFVESSVSELLIGDRSDDYFSSSHCCV